MNQQISDKYQVTFQPYGITVEVGCGENLLELARRGGVGITASCGGDGVCGTCKVKIIQGEVDSPPSLQLCNEEVIVRIPSGLPVPGDERLDRRSATGKLALRSRKVT